MAAPTLRLERRLLREGFTCLAAADEVGRGALCGPVTIGMVVVTATTPTAPRGVRDSKLLTEAARERLAPQVVQWATASAVGHASAAEIDEYGLPAALRIAGRRAFAALATLPDVILLDGSHDFLTPSAEPAVDDGSIAPFPPVRTQVKADLTCAAVAAASILAKVARDRIMRDLAVEFPAYGWDRNKGYGAADHLDAIARWGPTLHHRRTWRLPAGPRLSSGSSAAATGGAEES